MRVKFEDDEQVEVQMAPLIDCVFLLLIFFLVATTLKKIDKELPLDLPVAAASVSKQVIDKMTIVSIDKDGNFYLGSDPVGQGYLAKKLHEVAAEGPEEPHPDRRRPGRPHVGGRSDPGHLQFREPEECRNQNQASH